MNYTRRTVLKNSVIMSGGLVALRSIDAQPRYTASVDASSIQDPKIKEVISRAIDTAIAAGASYADARMSHAYSISSRGLRVPALTEGMSIGVRALYQGYWGFASSPTWSLDEGARLGAAALRQAKMNVFGAPREIELAPIADLASGHWAMPVKNDPFRLDFDEVVDYSEGLVFYIESTFPQAHDARVRIKFDKTEKAFGSSLGQFTTQALYSTSGLVGFGVKSPRARENGESVSLDTLTPAGMGFEYVRDQDIREQCRVAYLEALEIIQLPFEPVDVGKYSVLLQQQGAAHLLSQSIGQATQIDRAMGYEANAGGTSYIVDPVTMVGSFKIGSPLVNISGDRSSPGSVGMVKWDDEGVPPQKFDLVKDGILANMQANREGAGWMKDHYAKTNQPFQSYGCGFSATSLDVPLIYNADLTLAPAPNSTATLDSMRSNLKDGLEIMNAEFSMDFQQVTGLGRGDRIFKIKNGKRVSKLIGAGSIFRTSELWGNVIELGGVSSARRFGVTEQKGEPTQEGMHSVTAPPMLVKELTVIDLKKKA